MTLRTIESEFSEALLNELQEETEFDLTLDGPIVTKLHPKVIWARLQQKYHPENPPEKIQISGWSYDCFSELAAAASKYPEIKLKFEGRPWALKQFLDSDATDAIIDFGTLGTIVLSKNDLNVSPANTPSWHELPVWVNYALSPEVWGPQGKWTRFHLRLQNLFSEYKLLKENSKPLYYILSENADKLKNHGFEGTVLEKSYVLVLPWSFSLSALEKLETTVRVEFSNVHP